MLTAMPSILAFDLVLTAFISSIVIVLKVPTSFPDLPFFLITNTSSNVASFAPFSFLSLVSFVSSIPYVSFKAFGVMSNSLAMEL